MVKLETKVKDYKCMYHDEKEGCKSIYYFAHFGFEKCNGYAISCAYYMPRAILIKEIEDEKK